MDPAWLYVDWGHLLLLHGCLSGYADVDRSYSTEELGQLFLQLLPVVASPDSDVKMKHFSVCQLPFCFSSLLIGFSLSPRVRPIP